VMFFLFAFVMGLSTGATVLIGQAFGAGEHGRIRIVVGTTLAIGLLLSLSVALAGGFFSRQLMTMLATPPDILDQASAYARIMLLTMPLGFVFLLMTAMIRGVGDALTPLLALALSTAIGLILTPILIHGSFGFPAAGITSPAWAAAIANALTLIRERAQRHTIALSLDADPQLGEIAADERKFKQILLNLLTNAVKFTPDGGRIKISARREADELMVAVHDTGIGIAPEDQQAVFEEFRQVGRNYTNKQEGTGLGLTLTRKFVELHGGRIWLESELGKGSTFMFTIPAKR